MKTKQPGFSLWYPLTGQGTASQSKPCETSFECKKMFCLFVSGDVWFFGVCFGFLL